MVSKNQIKLITSLQQKKYRQSNQLFLAEGTKVISEFYKSGWKLQSLFATENLPFISAKKTILITEQELKKISALKTPNTALALFYIPEQNPKIEPSFSVVLDGIQDPGNLGTIVRLCDWFGVKQLVCSIDTADCFNPKVVQASMGSLARVNVVYCDLEKFLSENNKLPVYGAFMDGKNIYKQKLPENAVLVLGNEGNGISSKIEQLIASKIAIPQFNPEQLTESLNVATAAAIILSEFHRTIGK
jgi:TrmH family RNA methyltransferase